MLNQITKDQIFDRIKFENPWWKIGHIESDYRSMSKRFYFDLFNKVVTSDVNRAVLLVGPRRVGKTVMLHHLVEHLIEGGMQPEKILFLTVESPVYNNIALEQLFQFAKEASGSMDDDGFLVIFDEIQYCREWEVHLKSLVDGYRHDNFMASGSAAAALKMASTESGAGRFTEFMLPLLTFYEYIHLLKLEGLIRPLTLMWNSLETTFYTSVDLEELNKHFLAYINFGGYPEVALSPTIQANPGRYIRQDIVDKVLLRDLPSLYGIRDTRELTSLFTTIAFNSGNEFSFATLSAHAQVPTNTTRKYVEYLDAAFLIKKVSRLDQSGKRFRRETKFKLYLTNPSLRSALFVPLHFNSEFLGNMVETSIYAQWLHRARFSPWYARWKKGEVDMVALSQSTLKPKWALEIKWSDRYFSRPNELKSLTKFCKQHGIQTPIVTTISKAGAHHFDGVHFQFLPAASYAYTVGYNTIHHQIS